MKKITAEIENNVDLIRRIFEPEQTFVVSAHNILYLTKLREKRRRGFFFLYDEPSRAKKGVEKRAKSSARLFTRVEINLIKFCHSWSAKSQRALGVFRAAAAKLRNFN